MLKASLIKTVDRAIQQLDNWISEKPLSTEEKEWYQRVRDHLTQAKKAKSIEEFRNWTQVVSRMILDTGRLDRNFMPAFRELIRKLEEG